MKKSKIIFLNFIVFLVFYVIFFTNTSGVLYTPQFIPAFYPIGITLITIIMMILNSILKQRKLFILKVIFIYWLSFFTLTTIIDVNFGEILSKYHNYYNSTGTNKNLINFIDFYTECLDTNKIKKLLEQKGIKVVFIYKGVENNNQIKVSKEIKYYYVNNLDNEFYVLVNIKNNSIIEIINTKEILGKYLNILQKEQKSRVIPSTSADNGGLRIFYINNQGEHIRLDIMLLATEKRLEFKEKEVNIKDF